MGKYILKRLLIFIPTLIVISLMAFIISINAPGDPVARLLNAPQYEGTLGKDVAASQRLRQEVRHKLGLDKPLFYFKLGTLAEPDTLFKVPDKQHRAMLQRMARIYGNWEKISMYYGKIKKTLIVLNNLRVDSATINRWGKSEINDILNEGSFALISLMEATNDRVISSKMEKLKKLFAQYNFLDKSGKTFQDAEEAYLHLISHPQRWKAYLPKVIFYGLNNQYHRWIMNIITEGDFGISYRNQQPIMQRIFERFWWSFSLTIISVFFAYLISIPIGILAAYKRDLFFDRVSSVILFMLYSLPNFFVGTLLLVLFANPDFFNFFPASGVSDASVFDPSWPFWKKLEHWAPHLVLPLITYIYGAFAFLSRQMRVGMVDIINQDYIRTARAKGLSEFRVVMKHALKNALLPIITVFANIFPLAIGGSVIIETIFSIPGMGLEIYHSILNYDYPMIVAVFTIFGFLTLAGYLVADILYAAVDPRIKFK